MLFIFFGKKIQGKEKKTFKSRIKGNVGLSMGDMGRNFLSKWIKYISNRKSIDFPEHLCQKIERVNEESKSSQISRRYFA